MISFQTHQRLHRYSERILPRSTTPRRSKTHSFFTKGKSFSATALGISSRLGRLGWWCVARDLLLAEGSWKPGFGVIHGGERGLALVSIDRMKGGGYHVAVESAAALEGGTAGRVAQAVASVEGRESPVKLEIRLVQRSKNE